MQICNSLGSVQFVARTSCLRSCVPYQQRVGSWRADKKQQEGPDTSENQSLHP